MRGMCSREAYLVIPLVSLVRILVLVSTVRCLECPNEYTEYPREWRVKCNQSTCRTIVFKWWRFQLVKQNACPSTNSDPLMLKALTPHLHYGARSMVFCETFEASSSSNVYNKQSIVRPFLVVFLTT